MLLKQELILKHRVKNLLLISIVVLGGVIGLYTIYENIHWLDFSMGLLVQAYPVFYYLALVIGLIFSISGIADCFFDVAFLSWKIQRFFRRRLIIPLDRDRLKKREQQRIAIFIAAWQEFDVIAKTLLNACNTINYDNYEIFVGTYPNDQRTQLEVENVSKIEPRVHKVITPEPGPTNKASNLNHVFNELISYELETKKTFEIIVMHDSEDVIHPDSLLLYNYLLPRMEMIQIPVFPSVLPLKNFTHWTYADEFAENHTKILRVRELTGGFVPSAGVGTAFTKRALKTLKLDKTHIFSPKSLTEDYQLGWSLHNLGLRTAFVNVDLALSKNNDKRKQMNIIATHALFPTEFKKAIKQKTRWNIGIILQGWETMGWKGSLSTKWNLFQDRKAIITAPVNFLAYFVFFYALLYLMLQFFTDKAYPVLVPEGSFLSYLIQISTFFLVWRLINRAMAVYKIYGLLPAITSVPRTFWANLINFCAIVRALYQYFYFKVRKTVVSWDKTAHDFPVDAITRQKEYDDSTAFRTKLFFSLFDFPSENIQWVFERHINRVSEDEQIDLLLSIPKEAGERLFPIIAEFLRNPSWRIRASACRSLSYLRLPRSIPHLKKMAKDSDWIVRSNATRALSKLGPAGEKALFELLKDNDKYARDAARYVLEGHGSINYEMSYFHIIDLL